MKQEDYNDSYNFNKQVHDPISIGTIDLNSSSLQSLKTIHAQGLGTIVDNNVKLVQEISSLIDDLTNCLEYVLKPQQLDPAQGRSYTIFKDTVQKFSPIESKLDGMSGELKSIINKINTIKDRVVF